MIDRSDNRSPDQTVGIRRWRSQVKAHHVQSIEVQENFNPYQDFWHGMAHRFKDDPFRKGDPLIERLLEEFVECETIIDIGGGAGRLALPLALEKKKITVVDSSTAMLEELRDSLRQCAIGNVRTLQCLWEEVPSDLTAHDGALCSHVTYGINDIEMFISNVHRKTLDRVVLISFMQSPQVHLGTLWELVHGERRIHLPGVPELIEVLEDMGVNPTLFVLDTLGPIKYESVEDALSDLCHRLYVNPGTPKEDRLVSALQGQLHLVHKDSGGSYELAGSGGRKMCLLRWKSPMNGNNNVDPGQILNCGSE